MDCKAFLMDHAVLQRTANNISDHPVAGVCRTAGKLFATVYNSTGEIQDGFCRREIGSAANGKLQGTLAGIPTGGPYKVELAIGDGREKKIFKDILVGDLWLLAGQSNMADSGFMPSYSKPDPMVHAFYMTDKWDIAADPLHDTFHAVAPVHGGSPDNPPVKRLRGTGPGLPFALKMYRTTGIPQGVIALAHGGTSLAQWDPAKKKLKGRSLYGAFYERLQWLGGKVAGLLWYQGCNDLVTDENSAAYERLTRRLFAAFRRDCRDPELPIIFVQLGPFIYKYGDALEQHRWMQVRDAQYRIGRTLKNAVCVPAIDLELDDTIHLSNRAVTVLGSRLADAALALREKGVSDQIYVKKVTYRNEKLLNTAKVRVEFGNVQGTLSSNGSLPQGFSLVDKHGRELAKAINARIDGNAVEVMTSAPYLIFSDFYRIAFGAGTYPAANITDAAGRSLPCFMQGAIRRKGNLSVVLHEALRSEAVYTDERLEALRIPENLKWHPAVFNLFYLPCFREAGELDHAAKVYCYKFKVKAAEDMDTDLLMGADAPFVLYCDGQEFCRQQAGNPIVLDEFAYPCHLSTGEHEFICVFSSNSGLGWGICCRFRSRKKGVLPEFIAP